MVHTDRSFESNNDATSLLIHFTYFTDLCMNAFVNSCKIFYITIEFFT